ncbi:MAG: CYTH domain protein [archaeon ADurb.Bin336]|nr:MAG: CYTH domain protein [archaeon ADurb.Bin336]
MYVEKEVKFRIDDIANMKKKLEQLGLECKGREFQRTIRFDNKGELKEKGLNLRVRSGSKNTLTLKSKISHKEIIRQREEIELEISDIEKMKLIINKLGFRDEKIMENYRTTYTSNCCEVVIDELPFGNFIEIEGEEKDIFDLIKKLGLDETKIINKTYWGLFREYKKENNLQELGEDILFTKK